MATIYEPITTATGLPDQEEWCEEALLTSAEDFPDKREITKVPNNGHGIATESGRGANGHVWETITGATTPNIVVPYSTLALETQLAAANIQLDEYARAVENLEDKLRLVADRRLTDEAVAVSNKMAMSLLGRLARAQCIKQDEICDYIDGNDGWLGLAWLMKAHFVEHMGRRFYATDRGRQVAASVFNAI